MREKRQAISVTQEEFAFKLGIHVNNLGNIERGVNPPRGENFIRLNMEWGIDMTKLVLEANAEVKSDSFQMESNFTALLIQTIISSNLKCHHLKYFGFYTLRLSL
ncbi:helix-turn-helix domain-containing protein [Bacillus sp. DJP31]|uniref:helix-turn-helix domain-containing protein n=1 Tax=Bacillus sp. DJP31 TaxID=3409789 RepID=UPI003BB72987